MSSERDLRSLEMYSLSYDELQTNAPAGVAHAEALVHPALVAHPSPKRVLVNSLSPVPIVMEVLKYKSVEHISIIGSDVAAVDLIDTYMPTISFLLEESPSCMKSAAAEVIEEVVHAWLEHKSQSDLFDIILVNVPEGEHSWLSVDMHNKLWDLIESEDAIAVVSPRFAPSLFDIDTETVHSPRESFLRQGARSKDNDGFQIAMLVYDEVRRQTVIHCLKRMHSKTYRSSFLQPLAKPLSSTNMVVF
jgi:hypothetical protein